MIPNVNNNFDSLQFSSNDERKCVISKEEVEKKDLKNVYEENLEHQQMNEEISKCMGINPNPDIFVKFKNTEINKWIPQEILRKKSDKFKALLSMNMIEVEKKEITIDVPEGIDTHSLQTFLSFLSGEFAIKLTGKFPDQITDDNFIDLLRLADEHQLSDLTKVCLEFIDCNMDIDLLREILVQDFLHISRLKWLCFIFISRFDDLSSLQALFQDDGISQEARKILTLGQESKKHQIEYPDKKESYQAVKLKNVDDSLDFLKELNEVIGINGLEITNFEFDQDGLNKLTQVIPKLDYLNITNNKISAIPVEWERTLVKVILCCRSLKSLSCPNIEWIYCWGCSSLQSLNLPKTKYILCHDCTSLKDLNAPIVEELYCCDCHSLVSLNLQYVREIVCMRCTTLESIIAPKLLKMTCSDCIALKILNAILAEYIDCQGCILLPRLNLPNVLTLNNSNCKSLSFLHAPKATRINSDG